jgi:hypothetical protein
MTADMRRWTKTAGAPSCPQGQVAVGNGQCLEPTETLSQDTRCCADLPEVYVPGEQTHYGFGKFSISRFVYIGHGARGYQYTAETLNHHMALKALHDRGERLGEEHRLIGATSTDVTQRADGGYDNGGFNGSSITNDFSIEAVLSNITGVNNSHFFFLSRLFQFQVAKTVLLSTAHGFQLTLQFQNTVVNPNFIYYY